MILQIYSLCYNKYNNDKVLEQEIMDLEKLPELLTMKQVSKMLGVSSMTLRRWDAGEILKPFRPTPRNVRRYRKEDIIKFINKK